MREKEEKDYNDTLEVPGMSEVDSKVKRFHAFSRALLYRD